MACAWQGLCAPCHSAVKLESQSRRVAAPVSKADHFASAPCEVFGNAPSCSRVRHLLTASTTVAKNLCIGAPRVDVGKRLD
jgi:hypothetical protein